MTCILKENQRWRRNISSFFYFSMDNNEGEAIYMDWKRVWELLTNLQKQLKSLKIKLKKWMCVRNEKTEKLIQI